MKSVLLIFAILSIQIGYGCSCLPPGKIDDIQFNKYDLIFKGKVVSIKKKNEVVSILFQVEDYYKGNKYSKTIKVATVAYESACGITVKRGEEWLVYAFFSNNEYNTNLCTRTKNMNPKAWNYDKLELKEDIEFLENKRKSADKTIR